MPIIPTEKQKEIFNRLATYLDICGYPETGYTGENDDSYKFGDPIRCYIKYISIHPHQNPPQSLKVIVRENDTNTNDEEFYEGNDFYGPGANGYKTRHVFVKIDDENTYNLALRLIDSI